MRTYKYPIFVFVLCCFIAFIASNSIAATRMAADCSQSAVQEAINSAASGDTINIPPGTCIWSSAVHVNKPVSLIGAGENVTIIIDDSGTGYPNNILTVNFSSASDTFTRISGLTLQHSARAQDSDASIQIATGGTGKASFRLDHITAIKIQRWLAVWSPSRGVIDHVSITNGQMLISDDHKTAWSRSLTLGSVDAWYVEDSKFTFTAWADGAIDCQYGARIVFRHNTVVVPAGSSFEEYLVFCHGYDSVYRGCMAMEVYENTFNNDSATYVSGAILFRGGTGVVFNNTFLGGAWSMYMPITNYRSCSGYAGAPTKGYCDGYHAEDGNVDHGWPCLDQIGRGTNQSSVPLYQWNNCKGAPCASGGSHLNFTVYNGSSGDCSYQTLYHVKDGRDYYNNTVKPGYVPYTYPHPLTGGTTVDIKPSPPSNFRITGST